MLSQYVYITSNESHLVKLLLCYKLMNITRFPHNSMMTTEAANM